MSHVIIEMFDVLDLCERGEFRPVYLPPPRRTTSLLHAILRAFL